jgi:hypothetical protein
VLAVGVIDFQLRLEGRSLAVEIATDLVGTVTDQQRVAEVAGIPALRYYDTEGVGAPESGSTGAEPLIGSVGLAIGIWIAVSADGEIAIGAVDGDEASPIGAMERLLFGEEFWVGDGSRIERVGGPPKSFPSSREFKELSGTTRLVPLG